MTADGTQLLEREDELGRVADFVGAGTSGSGGCLIIEGEAGIGKTALLRAAADRAAARGAQVLTARGGDLERDFAYGVIRQLFDPLIRGKSDAELDELLPGAARLARPILVPDRASDAALGPDPAFAAQHGLYWLVDNVAARAPVLLVVDDAHWADVPSMRFLLYLTRRLEGLTVCIALGWRKGESRSRVELIEALHSEPLAAAIAPQRLSAAATERLIELELGIAATPGFARACHESTGGNPFLLSEVVASVVHGELAPTAAAITRLRSTGPDAVTRSVFLRLARLGDDAAALAKAVAVLDVDTASVHAARLADLDADATRLARAALEGAGIFARGESPRFEHPILRGAVYGDLDHAERAQLHRAAAMILDESGAVDRAAVHLLGLPSAGDPWVAARLVSAGMRAIQAGAGDTAITILTRALAEPPRDDERATVLFLLGTAEQLVASPTAAETLRAAMDAYEEPASRWAAGFRLAREYNIQTRHRDAMAVLEAIRADQSQRAPEQALETEAHIAFYGLMADASAPQAGERVERVLQVCGRSTVGERMIMIGVGFHRALAMHGTAGDVAELVTAARPDEFVPRLHESSTALWACAALIWAGALEPARLLAEELLAHAQRTGGAIWVASAAIWRALVAYYMGELRDADAFLNESLQAGGRKFPLALPGAVAFAVQLQRLRAQTAAAEATLATYGFEEAPAPRHMTATYLPAWRALLRLEQGRFEDARRDAEAVLVCEHERGGVIPGVRCDAAAAFYGSGTRERARDVAERELVAAERWGIAGFEGAALRTLGLIEGGQAGLNRLSASVEVLRESPARLELALSLVEYGSALRRANQRQEAREPLTRGMDLALACGATAVTTRAREELAATGARPRSVLLTGVDALTASERRVAQLAAQGRTNREIAQALFVTKKTVETHLRHVFQKLDLTARTQLPDALFDPARPRDRQSEVKGPERGSSGA